MHSSSHKYYWINYPPTFGNKNEPMLYNKQVDLNKDIIKHSLLMKCKI